MSTINDKHPYWHVNQIVASEPTIRKLSLSYYIYRPQSLLDERTDISVSRETFLDPTSINLLILNCPNGRDLAFHSTVTLEDGSTRHIPMIDMSTGARAHLEKLKAFLDAETYYGFVWFESGRSFHGYGSQLITHSEWVSHMGQLLLSNQKDMKPTVDPRWIGHRLIAGYSALRWSRNTEHYLKMPQRVAT